MTMLKPNRLSGMRAVRKITIGLAVAGAMTVGAAGQASAWKIDFDAFLTHPGGGAGLILDNEYSVVAAGQPGFVPTNDGLALTTLKATFSAFDKKLADGPGTGVPVVLFDSDNPTGNDGDLGAPFSDITTGTELPYQVPNLDPISPGRIAIMQEDGQSPECFVGAATCAVPNDEGARPAGRFEIDYSEDVILHTIDFFDVEVGMSETPAEIMLFDAANNAINPGSYFVPETGGDNRYEQVDFFGVGGVRKMVIDFGGSGAFDNITGELTVTQVPEPAGLGLLAFGIVAMGAVRRRRQRARRAIK